jgi:glutathione S-transferase
MNFTELIRLSNNLSDLTMQDIQQDTQGRFNTIMYRSDVVKAEVDYSFCQTLADDHEALQQAFLKFEKGLDNFKMAVDSKIEEEGRTWLQKSYTMYEQQLATRLSQQPEAIDLHKNKPVPLDEEQRKLFKTSVGSYCNWLYPAMIIHPMQEPFIEYMIGGDPLYIVDESRYLIDPVLDKFNEVYRHRVRPYIIEESFTQPILNLLPDNQFGFCFVYNYLNYRPFEIIKKYLEEIYKKLAPGGTLIMTFNDCDRYQAIQLVEQNITCYTPGSLILGWINYLGFEEVFKYQHDQEPSTWLELRKPGKLNSLRGGQALAKILPKLVA